MCAAESKSQAHLNQAKLKLWSTDPQERMQALHWHNVVQQLIVHLQLDDRIDLSSIANMQASFNLRFLKEAARFDMYQQHKAGNPWATEFLRLEPYTEEQRVRDQIIQQEYQDALARNTPS